MQIVRVDIHRLASTTRQPRDSHGHTHVRTEPIDTATCLLEIETSDGIVGRSFGGDADILHRVGAPILLGADPMQRGALWKRFADLMRSPSCRLTTVDLAAIDVALWDLAGLSSGLPVHALVGGARTAVPAYASSMCGDEREGGLDRPEAYVDFALACKERGYQGFKLHTWMPPVAGAPSVARDLEACRRVREAVGDDFPLMLDPHHGYAREEALRLGRGIEELGFLWLEEPMSERSMSSYRWLADQLDIPVVGPETAPGGLQLRAEWALAGACDILRAGINDLGGITPTLKAVHLAEAHGLSIEMHHGGPATLQVLAAMTIPGRFYERGLLHPELDHEIPPPWFTAVTDPMDADGFVAVPAGPGIGWPIDHDYLADHAELVYANALESSRTRGR